MARRIFAELSVNEEVAELCAEENNIEEYELISFVEHEFGWLESSGITLEHAYIADADDTNTRARYINYVYEWAQSREEELEYTDSPLSYDEWIKFERWTKTNG